MNNAQLDMVLGYLNEGTEIDQAAYVCEDILNESNKEVALASKVHDAKLNQLMNEYAKAYKANDISEMNKKYSEIMKEVNAYAKEIDSIKVSKTDTALSIAGVVGVYTLTAILLKCSVTLTMGEKAIIKGLVIGENTAAGALSVFVAVKQVKQLIKDIKKQGVTADSLNSYKNDAKVNMNTIKKYYEENHKKNVEKVKERIAKEESKKK